jgi:hypothetical protein
LIPSPDRLLQAGGRAIQIVQLFAQVFSGTFHSQPRGQLIGQERRDLALSNHLGNDFSLFLGIFSPGDQIPETLLRFLGMFWFFVCHVVVLTACRRSSDAVQAQI